MRTPLQRALPTRPPPTSLLTQLSVIHDSRHPAGDQVGVAEGQLAVDHAVDAQRPLLRLDGGLRDGRVDQVEVLVGRLPRARCRPGRPRCSAGAWRRVTPGMRSSRRLTSTCRRPAPTSRPATAMPTAATDTAPATMRKTRRSRDSRSGRPRPRSRASVSAECSVTQVSRPTATGRASTAPAPRWLRTAARPTPASGEPDEQRPVPAAAGQQPRQREAAQEEEEDDADEERLVEVAERPRWPARRSVRA